MYAHLKSKSVEGNCTGLEPHPTKMEKINHTPDTKTKQLKSNGRDPYTKNYQGDVCRDQNVGWRLKMAP